MSPAPTVSVVIPTRNRPGFVRQAVDSALGQEEVSVEVIVVDDGSDDGEALVPPGDARLRVHRRAAPGGAGRARNEGIALATGDWVAFLDDDDLWAPHRLRTQLGAMGEADFGYCGVLVVDAARRVLGSFAAPQPETLRDALRHASVIPGPSSVVARAELLRQVGGFRDGLHALADWELWIRLAASARPAASGELLTAYTVHEENAHLADPVAVTREFDVLAQAHGLADAGPDLFGWLAHELRLAGRRQRAAAIYARSAWRHRTPEDLGRALAALLGRSGPDPAHAPRRLGPAWLDRYRDGW